MSNKYNEPSIERFGKANSGQGAAVLMPKPCEDRRTIQSELETSRQLRNELEVCIGTLYEKLMPILDVDGPSQAPMPACPDPANLVEVIALGNAKLHDFADALRRLNNRILL